MNAPLPGTLDYPFAEPPAPGTTLAVAPGVRWLRMPLPFALDHINLWLLDDAAGHVVLVDCGYGDAPTRALWEQHFASTLAGQVATRIVATHYHPDHLGNARWLSERCAIDVTMTLGEFLTAQRLHAAGGDHALPLLVQHGLARDHEAAFRTRGNRYGRGVPDVPQHYTRIVDGDLLSLSGQRWQVIVGHGHSPEHAALYSHDQALLIAGDMLLPRISTNVSIVATEPDGDPLARFLASLARFETLAADTLVLPSHGLPFRGAALRVAQLRAHHAARLAELEAYAHAAAAPVCAVDVLPVLFRRELDLQQRYFAMGEAIAHLNHLWHQGRLRRVVDDHGHLRFEPPA